MTLVTDKKTENVRELLSVQGDEGRGRVDTAQMTASLCS